MPHTQVAVGIHFSEQENPPFFFSHFFPQLHHHWGLLLDAFSLKRQSLPDDIADTD